MYFKVTLAIIGVLATLTAVTLIALNDGTAYATTIPKKDPGASGLAPGEEPQIPGWDPDRAEEDAPGIEAQDNCGELKCAPGQEGNTPGQEGLESGIIGPELKK